METAERSNKAKKTKIVLACTLLNPIITATHVFAL